MKKVILSLLVGFIIWVMIASGPPPFDILRITIRERGAFFWGFLTGISTGISIAIASRKNRGARR